MTDMSWWQSAVIYQVYPRSFQDTDGDGVGDLRGILRRIPYLIELGVDAIWISPSSARRWPISAMTSPTTPTSIRCLERMQDFDELLAAAHNSGLKILLDLVPNHTSTSIPGSWKAADRGTIPSATGICGAIPAPRARRPTIGCRNLAAAPGSSTAYPASTIITPSSSSSPT